VTTPDPGFEPAEVADGDVHDGLEAHIDRHFGPIAWVWHELASHLVHIDVYVVEPSLRRPYYTLVTGGMSERPMNVPDAAIAAGLADRAELMLCLPADWPLGQQAFADEAAYWPIRLLKTIARLPHEYDTWIGPWHSIPNGDPAEPYMPGLPFVAALVVDMVRCPPEARTIVTEAGKQISLLAVVPLHRSEIDLKVTRGSQPLLDAFRSATVSELFDPARPSTV
jgi:hypothetical protein